MNHPGIVIFGATGEIGRWLVVELTAAGETVALVVRNVEARHSEFSSWINRHGGNASNIIYTEGDVTHDWLGISDAVLRTMFCVRLVYNLSGRYSWGMTRPDATAVNVTGAMRVVEFAAALPCRPRVVHASGYLVASEKRLAQLGLRRDQLPTERQWAKLYRDLGAYEASKVEGDFAVRAAAKQHNIDLTIINPAAVIGHSESGEITQITGFGEIVDQLWRGVMSAIPGRPDDWVPHVPVDYVARFMAKIPARDTERMAEYTLLCPGTPTFGEFVRLVASHLGVPAPTRSVPVGAVKVLLKAGLGKLTGMSAEPLSFLVSFDFDTEAADRAAANVGLVCPKLLPALHKTLDHIIATGFGAYPEHRGGFRTPAGVATFVESGADAQVVLLHGLPFTSSAWQPLKAELGSETLTADLPGQGRSALVPIGDEVAWLDDLVSSMPGPIVLVAHSYACRAAVEFAARHARRISALVLISPYFLGKRLPFALRQPLSAKPLLRLGGARMLKEKGQDASHLRRPNAIKHIAERLQRVGSEADRRALRRTLATLVSTGKTPVTILNGGNDSLLWPAPAGARSIVIPGAGHDPQLTHASQVAQAIREASIFTP